MKAIMHITWALVLISVTTAFADAPVTVNLGTAASFGLLAGSGITNASPATSITGNVGSSPTPAVTGLTATQVHGTLYTTSSPVTVQAQADLTVAYNEAAGAPCGTDLTGTDLGGLTLVPGIYCFSSSASLTGTLTLDGQGQSDSQWIFQIGSTLITATNSSVVLINGAVNCNVFWQVGSSATIQTNNTFIGNIMALTSITLDGGTLNGRALARNGAVTIAAQETVNATACACNVMVSSNSAGTVTKIPLPYSWNYNQTVIASGLTSVEGLTCGPDRRVYAAQSGVYGGPMQIVSVDQEGLNQKTVVAFSQFPALATSGGPDGINFAPPPRSSMFFSTTLAQGLPNTGVWQTSTSAVKPVQSILAFPPNGSANGGSGTAFLINGPYVGDALAVDQSNKKVVRVSHPFGAAEPGIDFITNLSSPVGLVVNQMGNVFVSNSDGTIMQFASDGSPLGLFANTKLHNMNLAFFGQNLVVATQDGPVMEIGPKGQQEIIGNVVGGDGIAVCTQ